jgi:hypothetical protein
MDPRVVKPRVPARLIVASVLIALFVVGFILVATFYSSRTIIDARMTGVITEKQFTPAPERQINLSTTGALSATNKAGEFLLTVEVPQRDGTKKPYIVYVGQRLFESLTIGDSFDVGPYLVRSEKE